MLVIREIEKTEIPSNPEFANTVFALVMAMPTKIPRDERLPSFVDVFSGKKRLSN